MGGGYNMSGMVPNGKVKLQKQWHDTYHHAPVEFAGVYLAGKIAGNWKEGRPPALKIAWVEPSTHRRQPPTTLV